MNAWEEGRHRVVLSNLVQAYGIALAPALVYQPPTDTEWAYLVTGFSECIDSFFAFGLFRFALAKRAPAFFPPELVDTFEPVIQEEAPAYPAVRKLARLASPQSPALAPSLVRVARGRGLAIPGLGAHRDRARDR